MRGCPTGYWGKVLHERSDDQDSPVIAWHPLVDHSIDVAACLMEILAQVPSARRALAATMGWDDLEQVHIARLGAIAFLHDLGKLNVGFQSKVFPAAERHPTAPAGHVLEACSLLHVGNKDLINLVIVSLDAREMAPWFADGNDLWRTILAAWSHHGRPVPFSFGKLAQPALPSRSIWERWRYADTASGLREFGQALKANFQDAFFSGDPFPSSARFQAAFAGLVSLADWLGSSARFPYTTEGDGLRMQVARPVAREVLLETGVDPSAARAAIEQRRLSFGDIFGFEPNATQRTVVGLPDSGASSVVLLESETGSGKTEAAIAHALRLYREGKIDAVYCALPTRTSAVQIHGRFLKAVAAAFGSAAPPVVLAVPGYIRADDRNGTLLPGFQVLWDDAVAGMRGWAAENAKRYLAAPFATGTIDQSLMAVVRAKHSHMRAFCLSRTLLIVDEVHASDAYMAALTAELVRRHTAVGGHVLLMSATLGAQTAAMYLGGPVPGIADASAMTYPLVRMASRGNTIVAVDPYADPAIPRQRSKTIDLQVVPNIDNASAVADIVVQHVNAGARVLVIRNTVNACVDVLRILRQHLRPEQLFQCQGIPAPHHGRFAPEDRRLLDTAVEQTFGKGTPSRGVVLVATQTVEQSLDIDADILISDICPMDVFLQRLGRLHRHLREDRPFGYTAPQSVVLVPGDGLIGLTKKSAHGIGRERAYEDVRMVEATLREISRRGSVTIPDMNRELVEACVHPDALKVLDAEDGDWARHGREIAGRILADTGVAAMSLLKVDEPFGGRPEALVDDTKVSTRLGEDSPSAVFQAPPEGPFGQRIALLRIPVWMLGTNRPGTDERPVVLEARPEGFRFSYANRTFAYDADGLRRDDKGV